MRKLTIIFLLSAFSFAILQAQKKEIAQARAYIRSGENLDKAEQLMTDLLQKDSTNKIDKKVYDILYEIKRVKYENENEKVYLKQQYDTATIYRLVLQLFDSAEVLDSVESIPDKHGNTNIEYRKKHAEELNRIRDNLYSGGVYFLRKDDYASAFDLFDGYVDCALKPLYSQFDYANTDDKLPRAAYLTVFCGHKSDDSEKTLKHYDIARRDSDKVEYVLSYASEAWHNIGNDAKYLETLSEGFEMFPKSAYFFPRLVDHYTRNNNPDSALAVVNKALSLDKQGQLFLLAKSTILLNKGNNSGCLATSDALIAINDTISAPYINAGTACLNTIKELENDLEKSPELRQKIKEYYKRALVYMEKYRQLKPEDKDLWGPPLYQIYFNLNIETRFNEIEEILSN